MTTNITMVSETNCTTGEVIERPMTIEELEARDQLTAAFAEQKAAEAQKTAEIESLKQSARAKLVAGEPLTTEEAATIVI
jgi:hypothetical protein